METDPMRQVLESYGAAYNERDWTAMAEVMAPDVHWVDRRLASWGSGSGLDALIEIFLGTLELAPDLVLCEAEMVACGNSAFVVRHVYRGHFEISGGEVEFGFANPTFVANAQIVYFELFTDTALPEALDRFQELQAGRR